MKRLTEKQLAGNRKRTFLRIKIAGGIATPRDVVELEIREQAWMQSISSRLDRSRAAMRKEIEEA